MSTKDFLEVIPPSARPAIKVILAVIGIATGTLMLQSKAEAHINKKLHPIKLRVAEESVILEHLFQDVEEDRAKRGLKTHNIDEIRDEAIKRLKVEEAGDDE